MPTARTLAKHMTDEDLMATHTREQHEIARLIAQGYRGLTGTHVRMVKATGREMVSRARHNRQEVLT